MSRLQKEQTLNAKERKHNTCTTITYIEREREYVEVKETMKTKETHINRHTASKSPESKTLTEESKRFVTLKEYHVGVDDPLPLSPSHYLPPHQSVLRRGRVWRRER